MRIELSSQTGMAASADAVRSQRLARAAQEFEAQMMKELLKPMTGKDEPAGEQADGGGDAGILGEFSAEALAQAISRKGGFGIAHRIVTELSHSGHAAQGGNAVGDRPQNSAIKALQ